MISPVREEWIRQSYRAIVEARERFALRMILHGMFPSAGWTIETKTEMVGFAMRTTFRAIPPP